MVNIAELTVLSEAFSFGEPMPPRYSMLGDDMSPPIRWRGLPPGTAEVAIICDDPDAPLLRPFVHWVVHGIDPSVGGLAEADQSAGTAGMNDFGNSGYNGPRPPAGHGIHHYYFWVFALDSRLDPGPGVTGAELRSMMDGKVLEQNRLVGTYERSE